MHAGTKPDVLLEKERQTQIENQILHSRAQQQEQSVHRAHQFNSRYSNEHFNPVYETT